MAKRLDTEIIINLAGNLTAKARQYGANMSEFARRNERAMSVVKVTSEAAGRGLDKLTSRYTAAFAGFAGGAMLKSYTTLDRRISKMAVSAEVTRDKAREMFREIEKNANEKSIPVMELADAWDQVVEKTGDYKRAMEQLPVMASTIAGTFASGHDVGDLSVFLGQLGIKSQEDIQKAFETMNKQGKVGEFSFADAATVGAPVFAALSGYGGNGLAAARQSGALLQYAMNGTADKNQAATAVLSFMTDVMNKQDLIKKRAGIDVIDKNGVFDPGVVFEKLISKAMKNPNGIKLFMQENTQKPIGALGFNEPSLKLIAAGVSDYRNNGKLSQMEHYMHVDGTGSIEADAKKVQEDFSSSLQRLTNEFDKFKEKNLAEPVQELADALNKVNSDTAQNWLETGKNVAIVTGGLLAARKAFQIGKGTYDFLRPGKKGIPAGVADVFGSGVMPVYVTNMPGGGMGNGGLELPDSPGKSRHDKGGVIGMAINTASEISSLIDFPDTDEKRAAILKRAKENADRSTMWDDVKNWFTSAPEFHDPSPWASLQPQNQNPTYPMVPQQLQGNIEVTVKDDRVQVTRVNVNAPGVTLSAASGVRNVEQD